MTYFDTSALIKRFVEEKGSVLVASLIGQGGSVATAKVAYVEVYSGLTRKLREKQLSSVHYARACQQFESEWSAYIRVETGDAMLQLARDLIHHHPLRGFDAIHLASALMLKRALGEEVIFAAADVRLLQAAGAERLQALNVETAEQPSGTE